MVGRSVWCLILGVIIVMDLVESVEEIHKETMNQKVAISATEMATEDVMFVMEQEKILNSASSLQ